MNQRLEFPIEYSFDPEAQVIVATVPSLNHISSFGKDFAEAENNIIEAVLAYIESLQKGETVTSFIKNMNAPIVTGTAYQEVIDFLARGTTPEAIAP